MFAEASSIGSGQTARFDIGPSNGLRDGAKCVRFQRHMFGMHIGELRVYSSSGGASLATYTKAGGPGASLHKLNRNNMNINK